MSRSAVAGVEVRWVFSTVGRLDVVRLSGGEPFLRRDFPELARTVLEVSRPLVLHVTTNGSFPARVARFAERFPLPKRLQILVSFDGLRETHDASRGRAVRFDSAMETVRRLAAIRCARGVRVAANHTVISAASLRDAEPLRRGLAALGIPVQTVLAYEDSSMYGAERQGACSNDLVAAGEYPLHPDLDRDQATAFVADEIERIDRMGDWSLRWGKRYYLEGLHGRLTGAAPPRPDPPCVALRSHLRLLPDGGVPVCQFNTSRVGSLLEESFEAVWHGRDAENSRRWVDACPGCWAECEVIPSAIYSGDLVLSRLGRTSRAVRS